MAEEIKRQTAYKCTIDTLNKGIFVKKTGWESSYIVTDYGDFARVNIIAVVVERQEAGVVIDDGTGQISGRLFDKTEQLDSISIGDIVIVIGKPRDYNDKMYLTIEIIKKISPEWIGYRKKELTLIKKIRETTSNQAQAKPARQLEPEIVQNESTFASKERVAKIIKDLDRGSGANIDDVLRMSKASNGEEIISDMLMRGEIYEFKAGHVKLM
ncbi:MAG TPA: hypothetical protein VEC16_02255 [Alphaproteobacteria bacterium]|nr:hypothetical protein [Alphaproteobacteria bacterium]